jgi:membrane protein implicated in regulation of membrane protease activity
VVSLAEDTASVTVSVAAILAPVLVLGLFASLVVMIWWALRRRARRRGPPPARAA